MPNSTNSNGQEIWQQNHVQEIFKQEHHLDVVIGRRIKEVCRQASMTTGDLAAFMGLPPEVIREHEAAEIPLPLSRTPRLAQALGMPLPDLLAKLILQSS